MRCRHGRSNGHVLQRRRLFHIAAVVIGFGPTFAYGAYMAAAEREGVRAIPLIGRTIVFWDGR
jgi:hypothetical protein